MQATIDGKTYDTDNAELIMHLTYGNSEMLAYYAHDLYRTNEGDFFIHGLGSLHSIWKTELYRYEDLAEAPVGILPFPEHDAFDRIKGKFGSAKIDEIFAGRNILANAKKMRGVYFHTHDQAEIMQHRTRGYSFTEVIGCDPNIDEATGQRALRSHFHPIDFIHYDNEDTATIAHNDQQLHDRCQGLSAENSRNLLHIYMAIHNGKQLKQNTWVKKIEADHSLGGAPIDDVVKADLETHEAPYHAIPLAIRISNDACIDAFDWLVDQKYHFKIAQAGWSVFFVFDDLSNATLFKLTKG